MEYKRKFRSSFLSIFDNTLRITWIATLLIITNFAIIVKKLNEFNFNIDVNLLLMIFLSVFIISVFAFYSINWHISRYEMKDEMVIVYKNIFVKDRKEILIKNIANIVLSKNVFERLFKLTRIKIYANEKNKLFCDFEAILTKDNFDKYIEPFIRSCNLDITNKSKKIYVKFNFFEILKHSLLSISISSIVVIINFILLIFNMIGDGSFLKEIMYDFLGLIITLVGFIFPVIYSVIKNVLKYINFSIRRDDKVIHLSYGLFTLKEYVVPVKKVNGIIIDVSLLSKIFGCYKLNIINSGIGDKKSEIEMLFPISKKIKCREIMSLIFPEYNIDMNHKRQPFETIVIITIKIILIMLVLVIPSIYIDIRLAIFISLLLFLLIFIIYYIKRIIISDKYICIINGIFLKRIRVIKYKKVENVEIKEGIISKKFGLCKVYVQILADIKNNKISTGYITKSDVSKIVKNLS